MREQERWPRWSLLPVATGLAWLWWASQLGFLWFVLSLPLGGALLAAGIALLLWPGDRRIPQTLAAAALLGVLASLPWALCVGLGSALVLLLGSALCFPLAGAIAVWQEPPTAGVPRAELDSSLALKVGIDEAILGFEQLSAGMPAGQALVRMSREIDEARELFAQKGWIASPARYHPAPPPLRAPRIEAARTAGLDFEHLRFESEYEPHPDEPGRTRWQSYGPTRTAHAWLLRQRRDDRPWLVCHNGYRTGFPRLDLRLFGRFHHAYGFNVVIPVLPLHGPRRIGRLSGQGFLAGQLLDTIHAMAQAMWDARRLIGWLRQEHGAERIGLYGLSLGGYTTALLAGLEDSLACAIAGIPATDFTRLLWRHGPPLQLDYFAHVGGEQEHARQALRVIAPLAVEPRVAPAGRLIFGGVADRLVPPDQVRDLIEHWGSPRHVWYQGGHCTFEREPSVRRAIERTFEAAELI